MTQQATSIHGSIVALVTPMHHDGSVDWDALKKLVEWHIEQGTHSIVAVGTTGESATLDVEEHAQVIEAVIKAAAGRIPIIAGTGANSTREAIELTEAAASLGVDSALSVVPYYNRPTQEGMYQHFKAIAEACPLPLILYNVPGRTVADMSNDTALRLAEIPNIIGIKDATGNLERACDLVRRAPADFALYTGDDASAMAFMLCGGHGVISVTANVAPKLMSEDTATSVRMVRAPSACNCARRCSWTRLERHEANPIPVKWAMERMGYIPSGIRLPLTRLSEACQPVVEAAMRQAGVL